MARIPIALQLYSIRDDCKKDFVGSLKAVSKMGYEGVEFAYNYGNLSAKELKKIITDLNLKPAGAHIPLGELEGDKLPQTIAYHKELGNPFLIVPGIPEELRKTRAQWKAMAERFNVLSDALKKDGLRTGYHNHHVEFQPLEGELPWDTFFANTKPEVIMQVDTGNALHGNCDVVPFVEKYPGRALTVHVKEYSKTNDKALIGEGDVDFKKFWKLCEGVGKTQWYIVEQESYAFPPLECVDRCLKKMKELTR